MSCIKLSPSFHQLNEWSLLPSWKCYHAVWLLYQTTWHHIPEGSNTHSHQSGNFRYWQVNWHKEDKFLTCTILKNTNNFHDQSHFGRCVGGLFSSCFEIRLRDTIEWWKQTQFVKEQLFSKHIKTCRHLPPVTLISHLNNFLHRICNSLKFLTITHALKGFIRYNIKIHNKIIFS